MSKNLVFGAVVVLLIASLLLGACSGRTDAQYTESMQLSQGTTSIVMNQPVPNLGGYSLERDLLSQLNSVAQRKADHLDLYVPVWHVGRDLPIDGLPFPLRYTANCAGGILRIGRNDSPGRAEQPVQPG